MKTDTSASHSMTDILHVNSKKVSCDGTSKDETNKSSRHPTVYLDMGDKNYVICPYCSKYLTIK